MGSAQAFQTESGCGRLITLQIKPLIETELVGGGYSIVGPENRYGAVSRTV